MGLPVPASVNAVSLPDLMALRLRRRLVARDKIRLALIVRVLPTITVAVTAVVSAESASTIPFGLPIMKPGVTSFTAAAVPAQRSCSRIVCQAT